METETKQEYMKRMAEKHPPCSRCHHEWVYHAPRLVNNRTYLGCTVAELAASSAVRTPVKCTCKDYHQQGDSDDV